MRSLFSKIVPLDEIAEKIQAAKANGRRIVTTNGCFDLLHLGHVEYLIQARTLGDLLVVGLNSDDSVRKLKGPTRPIFEEKVRAKQLAALEAVDFVTIFPEATPERFLSLVFPHIHVKGGDYKPEDLPEKTVVEKGGGKVQCLPFIEGFSTTSLIEKLRN